jgi:hypothetical protein
MQEDSMQMIPFASPPRDAAAAEARRQARVRGLTLRIAELQARGHRTAYLERQRERLLTGMNRPNNGSD